MMPTHDLKIWPRFFSDVLSGIKTWEVRKVTDRNYQAGDLLRLREWDPGTGAYTGRELTVRVTYVLSLSEIGAIGCVGMSIEREGPGDYGPSGGELDR